MDRLFHAVFSARRFVVSVGLLAFVLLPLASSADEKGKVKTPVRDYNRTQAFVAGMADDLNHKAGTITNVLRKLMGEVPKIQLLDLSNQLKAEAPSKVGEFQAMARKELVAAKNALREMEHGGAVKHATKAREAFEKMGGYLDPLDRYKETLLIIAVGNSMLGDIKKAKAAFLFLLLLDQHLKLPKGAYEGFVLELFNQVKGNLSGQPLGSLSVRTEPPGANLYMDGKLRGVTPESMDGVIAGGHLVTVKMPGYQSWGKVVKVQPGEHEVLKVKLVTGKGGTGFQRTAKRACKAVTDNSLRGEILRLGQTIGLDWAVLGQLKHDSYDLILRLYLYEFSQGQIIYEDELVMDATGYGMEDDVRGFGVRFVRRGIKELKAFREKGDPLSSYSGTEDWNKDSAEGAKVRKDTKAEDEGSRSHRQAEEGDPLDDKDGTEDW